ncbi:MAG: DUF4335 domain-containing protein [Limnothrix sp.]
MNILRQYSLPNCTLILEGFDDGSGNGLQTLAVLSNAECRFITSKQVLNGGKVFFDHLVRSVSEYAQGLLSGLNHPVDSSDDTSQKVLIESVQPTNVHRLLWQQDDDSTPTDKANNEVLLTTTELFDLTEAIDQFLADGLTLPNFVLPLTPLSRRYAVPEQSLAERVTPPLIGISAFALTAFALFFMPVPEKTRPAEGEESNATTTTEQTTEQTTENSTPEGNTPPEETLPPAAEVSGEELDELLNTVPTVEDGLSLAMMQTYLYRTLNEAWTGREDGATAAYRLSVTTDGSIVGYQPIDGTTETAIESTPLPQLAYTPVDEAIASEEPVGEFKVVFDGKELQVSPWNGFDGEFSFDSSPVRGDALRELVLNTRRKIAEALGSEEVNTSKSLSYQLGVTDEGAIAFYISDTAVAESSVEKTPLPDLIQPEAAGIVTGESLIPKEPLTQVTVVFKPNGVVEVSPWAGYR